MGEIKTCKNCFHEIYNIFPKGNKEEDWVHKNHVNGFKSSPWYKCRCGCKNPEPLTNPMSKKEALHYLKVLKIDSSVFQAEIRQAIDVGIEAVKREFVTEELIK